jgi:hypothetical protein
VKLDLEKVLAENEIKEHRSRIAILAAELQDKNKIIDQINRDREEMEELSMKAMGTSMQIAE